MLRKSLFTDFSKSMGPYVQFDNSTCQFGVFATRSDVLSPLSHQKIPVDAGRQLESEVGVDTAAFECKANTDNVLCHVIYFVFDRLCLLILNCHPYSEEQKWSRLLQNISVLYQLPHMFRNVLDSALVVTKVTGQSLSRQSVMELHEDEIPVN